MIDESLMQWGFPTMCLYGVRMVQSTENCLSPDSKDPNANWLKEHGMVLEVEQALYAED